MARLAAGYGNPDADQRLAADVAADVIEPPNGRMADYLTGRTNFFDRTVASAIDGGTTQVIVAGAGYDARALRYGKPGVQWFELDHPQTQTDKRARFDRLNIDTDSVRFVPADFRTDDVAQALKAAGCDPAVPTLVLLEGVAAYLDTPVLIALLRGLRSAVAAGSRLAISVSVTDPSAEFAARRQGFQQRVAALGEPAPNTLGADEAEAVLAGTGWCTVAGDAQLRRVGFLTALAE
jgi:methyltransferase (TIGR00027 family)